MLLGGFLAVVVCFALLLTYSLVVAPDEHDIAGVQSARLFWQGQLEFFVVALLPAAAAIGALLGVLVGGRRIRAQSRRGEPVAAVGVPRGPLQATLLGAGAGVSLLVMGAFAFTTMDGSPSAFFDTSSLLQITAVGSAGGAMTGFAAWVLLTRRIVHPLYRALAGGFVGIVLSLPLHLLVTGELTASSGQTGYSDPMAGLETVYWYVLVTLPLCAITGVGIGAIRELRQQKRLPQDPRSEFRNAD